ncbi:MAG TPA: ferritin family protein [Sedimentisphaerales bacterium]|nr:ferritin family protein [Sedimentisphaerales bacterium]
MGDLLSVDEVLEFAIAREAEANEFYKTLAGRVDNPAMSELILEFAKDEMEHKARLELEMIKRGRVVGEAQRAREARKLDDFDIAAYIVDSGEPMYMEYEDLLLLGMKKEKVSFRLYVELAAIVQDQELQETLLSLAEEEAKHKVQLEIDYEDYVLKRKR